MIHNQSSPTCNSQALSCPNQQFAGIIFLDRFAEDMTSIDLYGTKDEKYKNYKLLKIQRTQKYISISWRIKITYLPRVLELLSL